MGALEGEGWTSVVPENQKIQKITVKYGLDTRLLATKVDSKMWQVGRFRTMDKVFVKSSTGLHIGVLDEELSQHRQREDGWP